MIDWAVRTATWAVDAKDLLEVRTAVFIVEQGVPADLEVDGEDPRAKHVVVRSPSDQAIATGRLLDNGHIGRMAVLAAWRQQGIGSAILQRLIGIARDAEHDRVFLNALCDAEGFYERAGFRVEGASFMDAGIPHQRMYLVLQQSDNDAVQATQPANRC